MKASSRMILETTQRLETKYPLSELDFHSLQVGQMFYKSDCKQCRITNTYFDDSQMTSYLSNLDSRNPRSKFRRRQYSTKTQVYWEVKEKINKISKKTRIPVQDELESPNSNSLFAYHNKGAHLSAVIQIEYTRSYLDIDAGSRWTLDSHFKYSNLTKPQKTVYFDDSFYVLERKTLNYNFKDALELRLDRFSIRDNKSFSKYVHFINKCNLEKVKYGF